MIRWIRQSWFSCEKYMERLSQSFEQQLTVRQRIGFVIHHVCCRRCRVARTHIVQLNGTLDGLAAEIRSRGDDFEIREMQVDQDYLKRLKEKVSKPE